MFKRTLVILAVTLFTLAVTTATFAQARKMGLFVGVNEYDGVNISKLKSCVNDAVNMQMKLSRKYGFEASNTSLLTDAQATRQNILEKLAYYERQSSKGDLFVFYYSGHGSIYPDALTNETDETEQVIPPAVTGLATGYYDSTIIPVDANLTTSNKAWGNMILDDELHAIFSRFTAKGAQVIFISDSCFSGTLAKSLEKMNPVKFVAPKAVGLKTSNWNQSAKVSGRKPSQSFKGLFLVIASSQDNQFSQAGNSQEMSLFTKIFIAKLDEFDASNKTFTYQNVLDSVKPEVDRRSGGDQTPRLDDRFDSSLLNKPIFSLQNPNVSVCTENPSSGVRIVVKVTDSNGTPISDASFGIFSPNARIGKDEISKSDVLLLGKTTYKGLYDSCSNGLPIGTYKIKVVKQGYRAFIKEMNVVESKSGLAVFVFKLVKE